MQWRTQEVSKEGPKFRHNRVTSQTIFVLAKTAWFCFTFLGSEGGHGTVASPLGTLVFKWYIAWDVACSDAIPDKLEHHQLCKPLTRKKTFYNKVHVLSRH